jgi:RNA polymerase sigma factor (sigma-70 family)
MRNPKPQPPTAETTDRRIVPISATDFQYLYVQYRPKLMAYLARHGCPKSHKEDIVQDAFMVLWQKRATVYDGAFFGYLRGIAKNLVKNARRTDLLQTALRLDAIQPPVHNGVDTAWNDFFDSVRRHLTAEQWQAVELVCINRIGVAVAAKQTCCTSSIFRARLYRARKKLQQMLSENTV